MAGRAIWKGVIHYGAAAAPVKLYTAVRDSRIRFNLLNEDTGNRLTQLMICSKENVPVPRDEMVKGYEIGDEEYVLVDDDELAELDPEAGREIEVLATVPWEQVDPRFFGRTWYLGPDGKDTPYLLLRRALTKLKRGAVCRWVMRRKSYLGMVRPVGPMLHLVQLHFNDDVVSTDELDLPSSQAKKKEQDMAKSLIDAMSEEFEPTQYEDEYEQQLRDLIDKKAKGKKVKKPRAKKPEPQETDDLTKALLASLKAAEKA